MHREGTEGLQTVVGGCCLAGRWPSPPGEPVIRQLSASARVQASARLDCRRRLFSHAPLARLRSLPVPLPSATPPFRALLRCGVAVGQQTSAAFIPSRIAHPARLRRACS